MYSGHPFHLLEGTLEGNGPWRIGDVTLSTMTEEHELWPYWLDYKAEYGNEATRAFLEKMVRETFP